MDYKKDSVNRLIEALFKDSSQNIDYVSIKNSQEIISRIKRLFYPDVKMPLKNETPYEETSGLFDLICGQIRASLRADDKRAEELTARFLDKLPTIKEGLEKDLDAFISGDPAATDKSEVILCYPGFQAILTYRLAHALYELGVPILPRVFTETAHARTGIDIHPAAKIGEYFFIDHGTGVVIGETAVIGNKVKIYQGVTLGAISLKNARGLVGKKRHPTVLDSVTVYANATVLGGDTVIDEGVTIPSAAFITESVYKKK